MVVGRCVLFLNIATAAGEEIRVDGLEWKVDHDGVMILLHWM
jgi:hypothetical protein